MEPSNRRQTFREGIERLREVLTLLPENEPEEVDRKKRMLAKFDQLASGESYAYKKYVRVRTLNIVFIVVIVVTAALIPASAIVPMQPFILGEWAMEPRHVTGLIGVVLSALLALYQALGLRGRQSGYLEMSNCMKALRDKSALLVRTECQFRALVEEHNALRLRWSEILPAADIILPG